MATLWKVHCEEDRFPGMWQRWFRNQCIGVGWPSEKGWHLHGGPSKDRGWNVARKALKKIAIDDYIVATLKHNRVGGIGVVTGKAIKDNEWNPLVPKSKSFPNGEKGRRVLVRWDMMIGPDNRDMVVRLPESCRLNPGEKRPTVAKISSCSRDELISAMNDRSNWVGLLTHFNYERSLTEYLSAYPHHLEDGLLPYPDKRVREEVFDNGKRLDVLLVDRNNTPVIVECKQDVPKVEHLLQIREYMTQFRKEIQKENGKMPRGILVHGGARKLSRDVASCASKHPRVEIVQYSLKVDFAHCD